MRRVLARRTVIQHLRNMFNAFNGAEAQDQESIRDLVHSVLHREEELFAKCEARTIPRAERSLQSERFNSKRTEEEMSLLRTGGTHTYCSEILTSPSDGLKNVVNFWIRSCQSHRQLQEKSVEDMRTILLLASMVKDPSRPRRFPTSSSPPRRSEAACGESKSVHS